MSPATLLEMLPPFQFHRDIKVKKQTTDNIIVQVLKSHRKRDAEYDLIASEFEGSNIPKKLFDFCKQWLPYDEEKSADQTTRSPAGILTLAEHTGVDCKHYANFIAGVLDALNRQGHDFNWCYRFVSYKTTGKDKKLADHVYVVILDDDVWIDPAPLKDQDGNYYERSFDDRYAIPAFYMDIKMDDMLSDLSGVHYYIGEDNPQQTQNGCGMGASMLDNLFNQTVQQSTATVTSVTNTAGQLAQSMVTGGLQSFLLGIFNNITRALSNLISGRKYTTGGYQLGEMFMRNILGMQEIQSNWDVPDNYVPLAEQFFTVALGLEIGADDHMNELLKSADAYYAWMPAEVDNATPRPVAERASRILKKMNYGWPIRDITWDLNWFAAEPYIYPIPDVTPGTFFTGTHPITNEELVNGYPVKPTPPPPPVDPLPADQLPPAGGEDTTTPTNNQTPPPPKQAGMSTAGMLILGLAAVGLVMSAGGSKPKRKRK